MSGKASFGTGRIGNNAFILVALSEDRLRNDHVNFLAVAEIIQATVALGVTILGTSSILVLDLLNLVTDSRKDGGGGNIYLANGATIVGAVTVYRTGSILLRNEFFNANVSNVIDGTNGDSITLNGVGNQCILLCFFIVRKEVATGRNTNADVTVATVDNTEGELNQLTRLVKSRRSGGIEFSSNVVTNINLDTTFGCCLFTHRNGFVSELRKVSRATVTITNVSQLIGIKVQGCAKIQEFSNLVN